MTGLESVLLGTVANAVSKDVLNWLKNKGPNFTEDDWKDTGLPVGRQIRATYGQHEAGERTKNEDVRRQLAQAGKIYRELSYIGNDRDFDSEMTATYSDLADLCAEWESSFELHRPGIEPEDHPDRFLELHNQYKSMIT